MNSLISGSFLPLADHITCKGVVQITDRELYKYVVCPAGKEGGGKVHVRNICSAAIGVRPSKLLFTVWSVLQFIYLLKITNQDKESILWDSFALFAWLQYTIPCHPVLTLALFSHAWWEQTVAQLGTKDTPSSPSRLWGFLSGCLSTDTAALHNPPANFTIFTPQIPWA